ncbi:MAG: hypothetical protein JWM55_610 [Acidimicrobiaceae bacterium]|nr:hypothetical protein [Acidimicrobiaceae bacterium]
MPGAMERKYIPRCSAEPIVICRYIPRLDRRLPTESCYIPRRRAIALASAFRAP